MQPNSASSSPLLSSATFETATETYAAYLGYWQRRIRDLSDGQADTDGGALAALVAYRDELLRERKALTPANAALINKAIAIYAPLLKALNQ